MEPFLLGSAASDGVIKMLLVNPNLCGGVVACFLDNTVRGRQVFFSFFSVFHISDFDKFASIVKQMFVDMMFSFKHFFSYFNSDFFNQCTKVY